MPLTTSYDVKIKHCKEKGKGGERGDGEEKKRSEKRGKVKSGERDSLIECCAHTCGDRTRTQCRGAESQNWVEERQNGDEKTTLGGGGGETNG